MPKPIFSVVDEILNHKHTESVARFVKRQRFDADMLTQRIETLRLCSKDIPFIACIIRRQTKAVRPIALIQKTVKEIRLPVQKNTGNTVYNAAGDRSQREIGMYGVFAVTDGKEV